MSTYVDEVVMIGIDIPENIMGDNFFDAHEDRMIGSSITKPGEMGILYDGMSDEYCLFGMVIAFQSGRDLGDHMTVPPIKAGEITAGTILVEAAFKKLFEVNESPEAALRVVFHYH